VRKSLKITTFALLLAIAIIAASSAPSTRAQRSAASNSTRHFELGEELHFEAEFSRALLRIWLGDNPVQEDLKKALLGG